MFRLGVILWLILLSLPGKADQSKVYLLGGFNYRGTPVTMAVLLFDKQVTDVEQCREYVDKRVRGKPYERAYYRHFVGPQRQGVSIFRRYSCLKISHKIKPWEERSFYSYVYLVDLRNGHSFTSFPNLDRCWASIRKEPLKHSSKLFCAKMSQELPNIN